MGSVADATTELVLSVLEEGRDRDYAGVGADSGSSWANWEIGLTVGGACVGAALVLGILR